MNQLRLPDVFGRRNGGVDIFRTLHREIDQLFNDFGRVVPVMGEGSMMMPINLDVAETDSAIEVTAELPGASPQDIDISLQDDTLTISGEKKTEKEDKQKNYHLVERSYGAFRRTLTLPAEVDGSKVDAKFDKGILKVILPKAPEARAKVQKIAVKSAS